MPQTQIIHRYTLKLWRHKYFTSILFVVYFFCLSKSVGFGLFWGPSQ